MPYRTDIAYLYDGSFEGLLCCVYESYYQKELPAMIFHYETVQETLFPVKEIVTDVVAAEKVERSIATAISKEALRLCRVCYFSHIENKEMAILQFLRMGYRVGPRVTSMLAHDVVRTVTKAAQNVQGESHFYREFLRFSEYNGALVAIIEPKNFVLPIIAPHYCDRFPSEQFLIYDKTHKWALVYQEGKRSLIPLDDLELPEVEAEEAQYRALWKRFYNTIAIEGRINPKRRMGNMPKRYWAQLTEFQETGIEDGSGAGK
ncbi:MAG: TIGR03915 family putative DNA repair protein [Oscillospiraceae bacterium]|nr:TIGR03915 family putative DNA repair protein [Oscillospiraceae bacterium]